MKLLQLLNEEDISPASVNLISGIHNEFVKEIGKHNNRVIMLINLLKILEIPEEEV